MPNASENAPDTRLVRQAHARCSATPGGSPARRATTPTRRSSAPTASPTAARPGPATTARSAPAAAARASQPARRRCRASATTARSAAARAGSCATRSRLKRDRPTTLWIAVAGSENSVGEAAREFRRLTDDPERAARGQAGGARAARRAGRALDLPGNRLLQDSIDWGKQNLADLTQTATDLELRWTDEGKAVDVRGQRAADQLGRRRLPRLPVAVRHRRRVHRARERDARPVRVDQGPHARAARRVRDPQRPLGRRRPRGRRGRLDLARQGHCAAPIRPRARSSTTSTRTRSSSSRAPSR